MIRRVKGTIAVKKLPIHKNFRQLLGICLFFFRSVTLNQSVLLLADFFYHNSPLSCIYFVSSLAVLYGIRDRGCLWEHRNIHDYTLSKLNSRAYTISIVHACLNIIAPPLYIRRSGNNPRSRIVKQSLILFVTSM